MSRSDDLDALTQLAHCKDRVASIAESTRLTSQRIAASGRGLDLTEGGLEGLDLSHLDLRCSVLHRARLYGANLSGTNLSGASLICPGLERANFEEADLTSAYMHAIAAQVVNFQGANLAGLVDATGSLFHGCNMAGVRATGAVLAGATFYQCNLSGADFRGASLQGTTVNECTLDQVSFEDAKVSQMTVTKCRMLDVSLRSASGFGFSLQRSTSCDNLVLDNAHLPQLSCGEVHGTALSAEGLNAVGADFHGCRWNESNLEASDLTNSRWLSCVAEGANFRGAKLSGVSIRNCLLPRVCMEGASGENIHVVESDLRHASMGHFAGRCAVFRDCDLHGADLNHAYLYRAMLTGDPPQGMNLCSANLESAVLAQAYVSADLREANLRNANGVYARFNQSDLTGADLAGLNAYQASMVKTLLANASLQGISPPIFIDRCPGLSESLAAVREEDRDVESLGQFVEALSDLLKAAHGSST